MRGVVQRFTRGSLARLLAGCSSAAARLRRRRARLKRLVAELGATIAGPWRADEKTATVAAWMALGRRH